MIDLEKRANEAETAFIVAARTARTDEDYDQASGLAIEYFSVLKLKRLKSTVIRDEK